MTTLQINQPPTPQPYPTGKKTIAQATITNTPTITTPRRQHKLPKLTFQFVNPQTRDDCEIKYSTDTNPKPRKP